MSLDRKIREIALLCALAAGITASDAAAAAGPKAITVTTAAFVAGKLTVAGKAAKPGALVSLAGTAFKTKAKADGSFVLSAFYRPASCSVQVVSAGHAASARVAACVQAGRRGPAGDAGSAGAAGPVGPRGPIGPSGPAGVAGSKGASGATGAAGPVGDTGPAGPDGSPLISAVVDANGELVRGSYVEGTEKSVDGSFYDVFFDRDVDLCAYVVTVGGPANVGALGQASAAGISPGTPNGVRVRVYKSGTSTVEGKSFHLIVACP